MARIPDGVIERLKTEVSCSAWPRRAGWCSRSTARTCIGRCPFHDDKTPSLVITPTKNLWHCLGACQAGGTVIDWVMKAEGVSFRHAVELLQNDYQPLAAALAGPCRQTLDGEEAADADRADARMRTVGAGDRVLPRDAARVPRRSITSSGAGSAPRRRSARSSSALPIARSGIGCRRRIGSRARRSAASCSGWGVAGIRTRAF
jgi:hypothetical protein